jgi:hypothetical protein
MLSAIKTWMPTDDPPKSYAGALIHEYTEDQFLENLEAARNFKHKRNLMYIASLTTKNMQLYKKEDITIDVPAILSIDDFDLAILVREPYAQHCVSQESSKDDELR